MPDGSTKAMHEPKPVVTLKGTTIYVGVQPTARLVSEDPPLITVTEPWRNAAELRAIADWLDQWQDATLLSEVG